MTLPTRWPQRTVAIVLVVAAGLFVVGVTFESDDSHGDEPTAETVEHNEARESAEAIEAAGAERSTNEAEHSEGDGERVLGIDVESPDLVATAVVVSLLLAALVWRRPTRRLLLIAVAAAAPPSMQPPPPSPSSRPPQRPRSANLQPHDRRQTARQARLRRGLRGQG